MKTFLKHLFIQLSIIFFLLICCQYSFAKGNYYRVTVLGASIKPLKAGNRCWDFRCSAKSTRIYKRIQDKVKKYVVRYSLKQLKRLAKAKGLSIAASMDPTGVAIALSAASIGARALMNSRKMPDPYAILRFSSGYNIKTHVVKDTLTPDWGTTAKVFLKSGDSLQVKVRDSDWRDDDPIGYKFIQITSSMLKQARTKGSYHLKIYDIPQMYRLNIVITRASKQSATRLKPGRYKVTAVSADIRSRKRNGRYWDAWRGAPDPFLSLYIGKNRIRTSRVKNSYHPTWNRSNYFYISGREKLTLYIIDKDFRHDDTIGACTYLLQNLSFQNGKLLTLECGQARQITIRFEKQ